MRRAIPVSLATIAVSGTLAGFAAAAAAAHAGTAAAPGRAGSTVTATGKHTVVTTHRTKDGRVLATASGRTLYLFEKDKKNKSRCSGECAEDWPPLMTKHTPTARGGVKSGKLGSITRGSARQVTYNGHPLYTFAGDGKAGQANGENIREFGAKWYVVTTAGKARMSSPGMGSPSSTPTTTSTSSPW